MMNTVENRKIASISKQRKYEIKKIKKKIKNKKKPVSPPVVRVENEDINT